MASSAPSPLWIPVLVAAGVLTVSNSYYYFTTIHLTAILVLCGVSAGLDQTLRPLPDTAQRWVGGVLSVAIHLGFFVGVWVSVYLLFESCGIRAAAETYQHSLVTVLNGHLLQHAVLPGAIWLAAANTPYHITGTPLQMLLPVTCFVAYSSYAQPCQIYPLDDATHVLPILTAVGAATYALLVLPWAYASASR